VPDTHLIAGVAWLIVSGIGVGFVAAAPIGAVNIICIRRTLAYGPVNGLLAGLGAALGDAMFAVITAFGFTALFEAISGQRYWLELIGGLILIGYGVYAVVTKVEPRGLDDEDDGNSPGDLIGSALTTFGLTIINPATLIFFAAFVAGLTSLTPTGVPTYASAGIFVGAVFAGSTLWWLTIVSATYLAYRRIGSGGLVWINRITGALIGTFGIAVLVNLFYGHWVA
jgi:threonine/homoserine/homoserine lactone efflux protein